MMLSAHLLLAATALCCFATTLATPMDGFATDYKCRCLTTTSKFIPMRFFRRIEILPPGANCGHTEILITMRDNNVVCVSPDAEWINVVIAKISQRSKRSTRSPGLTSTS